MQDLQKILAHGIQQHEKKKVYTPHHDQVTFIPGTQPNFSLPGRVAAEVLGSTETLIRIDLRMKVT